MKYFLIYVLLLTLMVDYGFTKPKKCAGAGGGGKRHRDNSSTMQPDGDDGNELGLAPSARGTVLPHTVITLYEHEHYVGLKLPLYFADYKCFNLPDFWNDEPSSVNLGGGCVILYDGKDCVEASIYEARLDNQNNPACASLVTVNLNDDVSSLKLCPGSAFIQSG